MQPSSSSCPRSLSSSSSFYEFSGHCQCNSIQYRFATPIPKKEKEEKEDRCNNSDNEVVVDGDGKDGDDVCVQVFTDHDLIPLHETREKKMMMMTTTKVMEFDDNDTNGGDYHNHHQQQQQQQQHQIHPNQRERQGLVVGQICICHCGMCRHSMGGSTAPIAMALPIRYLQFRETSMDDGTNKGSERQQQQAGGDQWRWTTSHQQYPKQLQVYTSSSDTKRYFCNVCGCSLLFRYPTQEPNTIWIYVVTLQEELQRNSLILKSLLQNPNVICHICCNDQPLYYYDNSNCYRNNNNSSTSSSGNDNKSSDHHEQPQQLLPSCPGMELWIADSCKP